jgi:hypothetical protein
VGSGCNRLTKLLFLELALASAFAQIHLIGMVVPKAENVSDVEPIFVPAVP